MNNSLAPLRLAVVVPVLNEAHTLSTALLPLQPLRRAGVEIIVVDGGSDDRTLNIAAPLADQTLSAPRGRATQMHAGAQRARAPILLFLHADTALRAQDFETVAQVGATEEQLWGRFDVQLDDATGLLRVVQSLINLRSRLSGVATGDQAMFVSRELYFAVGGFPAIALMEDVALSKRLLRHGKPLCLVGPAQTSARRWHQHGVCKTIALMWFLRSAYALGASPTWLKRWYADHTSQHE